MLNMLSEKTHEIEGVLISAVENGIISCPQWPALYNVYLGTILFLESYLHKNNKHIQEIYESFLDDCLEKNSDGVDVHPCTSGLAGVMAGFKMMNENSLFDLDLSDVDFQYKKTLLRVLGIELIRGHYDFMHGELGIAISCADDHGFAERALVELGRISVRDGGRLKWVSGLVVGRLMGYHVALSYGMSSVAVYLSWVYSWGVMFGKIKFILNCVMGIWEWLWHFGNGNIPGCKKYYTATDGGELWRNDYSLLAGPCRDRTHVAWGAG